MQVLLSVRLMTAYNINRTNTTRRALSLKVLSLKWRTHRDRCDSPANIKSAEYSNCICRQGGICLRSIFECSRQRLSDPYNILCCQEQKIEPDGGGGDKKPWKQLCPSLLTELTLSHNQGWGKSWPATSLNRVLSITLSDSLWIAYSTEVQIWGMAASPPHTKGTQPSLRDIAASWAVYIVTARLRRMRPQSIGRPCKTESTVVVDCQFFFFLKYLKWSYTQHYEVYREYFLPCCVVRLESAYWLLSPHTLQFWWSY